MLLITAVFLVYPLGNAMLLAFVKNGEAVDWTNLTLVNFARFFTAASYQRALWNSVYSGLAATLLATAIALPMAYAVARIEMPHRGLISAMTVVPLISPPFIGAYAWIILLGNNGTITQWVHGLTGWTLPTIYGPPGVILALALSYFPYVFLIVQGALAAADPHIEEAARMAGASRARILRTITAPLVFPAIAAAMLIVFIKAIGDFGVPSILGGEFQVLPTLIYYQIHGFFNLNAASAIAMVNVLLTLVAMLVLAWINRHRNFVTVGGTSRAADRHASRGARVFGNVYCWLVIFVAILPQLVIALASFAGRWPGTMLPEVLHARSLSLRVVAAHESDREQPHPVRRRHGGVHRVRHRDRLRQRARSPARPLGARPHDHAAVRAAGSRRRRRLPDGVQQRLAGADRHGDHPRARLLHAPRRVRLPLGGRPRSRRSIPSSRTPRRSAGRAGAATMRRVMVPLAAPAILAGAILVFSTLIGEISATVLLYSAKWKTISIAIYELVLGDQLAQASAIGTITTVMTLLLVLVASRLAGKNMAELFR